MYNLFGRVGDTFDKTSLIQVVYEQRTFIYVPVVDAEDIVACMQVFMFGLNIIKKYYNTV